MLHSKEMHKILYASVVCSWLRFAFGQLVCAESRVERMQDVLVLRKEAICNGLL